MGLLQELQAAAHRLEDDLALGLPLPKAQAQPQATSPPSSATVPATAAAGAETSLGLSLSLTQQQLLALLTLALQTAVAPLLPIPPMVLPTTNLQQVTANANLLQTPFRPPYPGEIWIAVRPSATGSGGSLQISRDGSTWGTFGEAGGGSLTPGGEYTFATLATPNESISLSMSQDTSLDALDVFFLPPGKVT